MVKPTVCETSPDESTTICYGQIVTLNEVVTDKMLQVEKCYATKLLQDQMLHTIKMLRTHMLHSLFVTKIFFVTMSSFTEFHIVKLTLHRPPPPPVLLLLFVHTDCSS